MYEKIYSLVKNNLGIKIGCFALAVLLWFYVTSGLSMISRFTVPITWKNLAPNLLIAKVNTNSISIRAEGEKRTILRIRDKNFHLGLDLSEINSPGNYIFKLSSGMISAPSEIKVVHFSPQRVIVTLKEKRS